MASISSTSSLGNTSLRGFGGMASGIDRDAIIEKMTLGTTTKISNEKKKMTQLEWKQEAYRGISDKIIDWSDTYASYASSKNLKDSTVFSKNQITVHGTEDSKNRVSVTGSSDLIDNLSILGVKETASSAIRQSGSHIDNSSGLEMTIGSLSHITYTPKLQEGASLVFTTEGTATQAAKRDVFQFKAEYTDKDNEKHQVNYAPTTVGDYKQLVEDLNAQLELSNAQVGQTDISKVIKFKLVGEDGTEITDIAAVADDDVSKLRIKIESLGEESDYMIQDLTGAFGYKGTIKLGELNGTDQAGPFSETGFDKRTTLQTLTNEALTFDYNEIKKSVKLITTEEANAIRDMKVGEVQGLSANLDDYSLDTNSKLSDLQNALGKELDEINKQLEANPNDAALTEKRGKIEADLKKIDDTQLNKVKNNVESRLDQAFGKDAVKVSVKDGKLNFTTLPGEGGTSATISVTSNNVSLLNTLGVEYGASNKINLDGKLMNQKALGLTSKDLDPKGKYTIGDSEELNLVINGVQIKDLTKNSSINDILTKINSTKEAGVKATYVDATGQFMLVSSETGKGRDITFGYVKDEKIVEVEETLDKDGKVTSSSNGEDSLAWKLFGGLGAKSQDGKNAQVLVSYGNGAEVMLERSSNSFNLEGLNITVSGTFGNVHGNNTDGFTYDDSATVTFSAKADVDGALERVKAFVEDYNALVTEINNQITTRPNSDYGPLTDEQKEEMDDTSIENWEKKAKQGMLYGDSAMRDLSMDVQSIFTRMMTNGADYENDLKAIGITYAEDWGDGGTLVFDETKFRQAMENDPEKVSNVFTGGGDIKKGLIDTIEDVFTPYATRYATKNGGGSGRGSYGRLIEIAGSSKKPTTLIDNEIYKQLEEMQKTIDSLNDRLKTEQDRYISQFTTMETLLNQMNTQSSYLSQLTS